VPLSPLFWQEVCLLCWIPRFQFLLSVLKARSFWNLPSFRISRVPYSSLRVFGPRFGRKETNRPLPEQSAPCFPLSPFPPLFGACSRDVIGTRCMHHRTPNPLFPICSAFCLLGSPEVFAPPHLPGTGRCVHPVCLPPHPCVKEDSSCLPPFPPYSFSAN